jgi:tRNA pseudouridine32 synthase / 23S rRNA pseudouridine746 synthase
MNGSALGSDGLRVIRADRRFVVVDKPAGLLSVPGLGAAGVDNVASRVAAMFPGADGPLVCHRLDQATSGVMVFGLDADAQRLISLQFQNGRVDKRYEALVWGEPGAEAGRVTLPLVADWPNRPMQKVDHEQGKRAETLWRVIGREALDGSAVTRLELTPLTGKTHQLRLHAAAAAEDGGIGCPIVGDTLYDPERAAVRLMLHARWMEFTDPETLRRVWFESAVPF